MAQTELSPTINVKPEAVRRYANAISALIGQAPPEGEVTQQQMHRLIRAIMNYAVVTHEAETTVIVPPEGVEAP